MSERVRRMTDKERTRLTEAYYRRKAKEEYEAQRVRADLGRDIFVESIPFSERGDDYDRVRCSRHGYQYEIVTVEQVEQFIAQLRAVVKQARKDPKLPWKYHGTDLPGAKLEDDKVREIRRRRASGETMSALAREYGVNPATIRAIVMKETWRHVE